MLSDKEVELALSVLLVIKSVTPVDTEKTDDREGFLKAFGELADDSDSREAKIGKVKKYYSDCAVDSDAKIEIAGFTWKALEAVSNIGLKPENIEMLRNFAEKLVGRAR